MITKETIEHISDHKIIMIVRGVPTDRLIPLGEAVWRGGIRMMECTYDASGITSDEVTAERIALLSKHFEGRMAIGAGTVLKKSQIALTKAAGGQFIISPDTNEEIIKETKKAGLVSIPGALTPSEATTAHRAGADFVKTSTGFTSVGATVEGVAIMIDQAKGRIKVKASGGIRDYAGAKQFVDMGVDRLGIGYSGSLPVCTGEGVNKDAY